MSAREKPTPLVWIVRPQVIGPPIQRAIFNGHTIDVWEVGGEFSHRSRIDNGRIASHFGEDSAKASAEKRLRKAARA